LFWGEEKEGGNGGAIEREEGLKKEESKQLESSSY